MQTQAINVKDQDAWKILEAYWNGDLQKDQAEHKLAELHDKRKLQKKAQ